MKIITRAGGIRLAVLGAVLAVALSWCFARMIKMPLKSYAGPLPPLTPEQKAMSEGLRQDLKMLAETIGERNVFRRGKLPEAANFIEQSFAKHGYRVRRQNYSALGDACENLEVELRGRTHREEIVVVGAHYDSVSGCAGANDNGSGTVALLALAARFAKAEPGRTLRLVAFANEEPPFFQTNTMGSWVYARELRQKGERIVAMLSLECMGFYSDAPGTQKYPFPLGLLYPSTGNFFAFVGNTSSGDLVRECIKTFRQQVKFPSEGAALPANIPGVGWSDHWAFWQEGYPALMVTDTAVFRYPHYHTTEDTPDKVDYERLARVTDGVGVVLDALLNPDRTSSH